MTSNDSSPSISGRPPAIWWSDEVTGTPVPNVNVLLRYEHVFLEPRLMALARQNLGTDLRTRADGTLILPALPAGLYEIWIYGKSYEGEMLMRGGVRPAATVLATTGLTAVSITIRAK
jgi:hypothetical protein